MLGLAAFVTLAGLSLVDARPIPHPVRLYRRAEIERRGDKISYETNRQAPANWALEHNEPYKQYHFRYLQVGCAQMHDTAFFESCCHPRIYYETDADYEFQCSLAAHITNIPQKQLAKQVKVANAEASGVRESGIESISSASVASRQSIKSEHAASRAAIASASSASVAAVESAKAAKQASRSAEAAAEASSKAAADAAAAAAAASKSEAAQPKPTPKPSSSDSSSSDSSSSDSGSNDSGSDNSGSNSSGSGDSGSGDSGSSSGGSSSSGGYTFGSAYGTEAWGTWFKQAGTIGACGIQSAPISDWDKVVAMRYDYYGSGENCGRHVEIKNIANGKTVIAMENDECMGCKTKYSLDLSLGAFAEIADFATGMVEIEWRYVD